MSVTLTIADITASMGASNDYEITLNGFTGNSTVLEFTKSDTPSVFVSKQIPFTIRNDTSPELTETFTISLSNPDPISNATLNANNKVGTATIYDNDSAPELTIAADSAEINEAMSANFTITADVIPVSGFTFKYQVSQEGDYLAATVNTINPQTASPTFTGSRASYTAPLNLMIAEDSEGEPTGVVKVELLAADGDTSTYTLGSDFEAEVKVFDNDLPELTIAGVDGTVVEGSGDKVQFTVTSSYDTGIINVRYQVIDTGSNFLTGDVEGSRQESAINFNNTKTATLEFNVEDDDVVEEDGVVRVQLMPDFHVSAVPENQLFPGLVIPGVAENPIEYTVVANEAMQVAEVMVQDNDSLGASVPTITLVSEYLPSDSTTATYYIVADSAPAKDLEVILEYNYESPNPDTVTGGTIDFYQNWLRTGIVIPSGQTRGTFTQSRSFTSTYSTNSPPGYIQLTRTLKVRLVDGDHYNLGNPSSSGLPTNEASTTNPLVTISVVGDNRVVESSGVSI